MRANEIIRSIIDLIDNIDGGGTPSVQIAINSTPIEPPVAPPMIVVHQDKSIDDPVEGEFKTVDDDEDFANDDIRRFKQIVDLLSPESTARFSNTPNEQYADIESVTTDAGGGVNNPKHPSDQRVQHPSLYPGYQHNVGE